MGRNKRCSEMFFYNTEAADFGGKDKHFIKRRMSQQKRFTITDFNKCICFLPLGIYISAQNVWLEIEGAKESEVKLS